MSSTDKNSDNFLDSALRPVKWDEYVGQESIKENLHILLEAARGRNHPPEHLLFYGPPGLGKTTLAYLIAAEMGAQIKSTSGPAIERVGDLASILTNLASGDILFIDEVHRLNKMVEEVLYPAMESGAINIIIGKGPSARTIQLDLPPFTLIAATTRVAGLSGPLRSRFSGGTYRLEFYSTDDIKKIIKRSAKLLEIAIDEEGVSEIASRARATPRIANQLLKRCRDYAQVKQGVKPPLRGFTPKINKETAQAALEMQGVDEEGLNAHDRRLLEVLIKKFNGGPVGVNTLATALSEEEATIEEVHEPYLIQLGFLERTPRGRLATEKAYKHLNLTSNRLL